MDREQRNLEHKKQSRISIKNGRPTLNELTEGIPVIRKINNSVYLVAKIGNKLYYNIFTETI